MESSSVRAYLLLLILTIILATGCTDKHEEMESMPLLGRYQSMNTIAIGPAVLYTSTSQTTDLALIRAHLKRKRTTENLFALGVTSQPISSTIFLAFPTTTSATITEIADGDTLFAKKTEVVRYSSSEILLASLDSLTVIDPEANSGYGCEKVAQQIRVHKPTYVCRPVSIYSGTYSSVCRFRRLFPLQITDGNPSISRFSWLITNTTASSWCGIGFGNDWNSFNRAVINQLQSGDTLIVQETSLPLLSQ